MNAEQPKTCPKCGREMSAGYMLDATYGGFLAARWIEGAPEKSFWQGLKIRDKKKYQLTAYRCVGCGFLESYADQEVP